MVNIISKLLTTNIKKSSEPTVNSVYMTPAEPLP